MTASSEINAPPVILALEAERAAQRQEARDRARARAELAARSAQGPQLMLWAAATRGQATICRPDGRVIWRQCLNDLPGLRVETELDAIAATARQAIWIAGQARLEWGAEAGGLRLIMDRYRRSLLDDLHRHAYVAALALKVMAEPIGNPARHACAETTPVDWHPNLGLADLLNAHRIPT
ncbi:hypothetical protein [Nocardia sp. XZ_19_385]|uniref:hypothetical protein n=1 Tax=Nocardia sp. XZ_19_385 TaxID=2769488 RepID=UPI00188F1183|nr:hypothetical protein [Nocardia sp. XZ_19_385]